MRSAVQEVGAVVPDDGGGVVFSGRAGQEVEVAPACCRFGVCDGGGPFADDNGDVGEVVAYEGKVRVERGFVGVGSPGCFAPGAEDEVVYVYISLVSLSIIDTLRGYTSLNVRKLLTDGLSSRFRTSILMRDTTRNKGLTRRIIMPLNPPRIQKFLIRPLKPLRGLNPILTRSDKRNNSLRIESSSIVNRLQEDSVESVDSCSMLRRCSRDFVDRLER